MTIDTYTKHGVTTLTVNGRPFLTGQNELGFYTGVLQNIVNNLRTGSWQLMYDEFTFTGKERYTLQLRERVALRLMDKLNTIERIQNKVRGGTHVHWSHSVGRFIDDGE